MIQRESSPKMGLGDFYYQFLSVNSNSIKFWKILNVILGMFLRIKGNKDALEPL